jgi:hypothetical protein
MRPIEDAGGERALAAMHREEPVVRMNGSSLP